jgi:hypothetical protein
VDSLCILFTPNSRSKKTLRTSSCEFLCFREKISFKITDEQPCPNGKPIKHTVLRVKYAQLLRQLESLPHGSPVQCLFVYYESIKRKLKRRLIYEYWCDERLKTKNEGSTRLADTGLVVELEHLKTKTRLIDEKFASARGECET